MSIIKKDQNRPRIVIVGAGSLFFGRQAIWAVNNLPGLKGCTLALVDNDPAHLEKMSQLSRMEAEFSNSGTRTEAYADYREALPGADFVVLSFSDRNAHFRRIDCEIAEKLGIRMCSGDTIGPGGVFRTMREFPKILEMADAVEEICPDAWLINYVNPSAIMGIGLSRYSGTKNFALCDSHHLPQKKSSYLALLGEDVSRMDSFNIRIAGVNHFTWMLSAELDGRDVLPQINAAFHALGAKEKDQGHSKARFNNFITAQLADLFGAIPTCTGHTKEYVPYYQGRAVVPEPIPPLAVFDADGREALTAEMWEEIEDYVSGRRPMSEFQEKYKSDHATDIIHTMVANDGRTYFINCLNNLCPEGLAVGNLPPDAFLELECQLDKNGPRPMPVGDFPLGLRALQTLILDVHELTIEAIMKKDRGLLVRALAMDPIVNSIATAKAVIEELFKAESDVLGDWPSVENSPSSQPELAEGAQAPQLF